MRYFSWLAGLALLATSHLAVANGAIVSGAPQQGANRFSDSGYPVSIQTCTRQGQAFSCGPLQVLDGYDNLTQTNADNIMAKGGCSNRGNLIYVCTQDTPLGQAFGGTSLVWAVVYGPTAGTASTAAMPVSTVYVYVLN